LRAPTNSTSTYEFNIYPVTDDNPFFYNYFRWTNLTTDSATIGRLNRFPIGNLILLTLIGLAVITSVLFVILPLWRHERAGLRTPQAMPMLAYFSLGAGYIFVEIILIQRFTLFIGYPTLAVTTSIFSMLTFSAVGSLVSQRLQPGQPAPIAPGNASQVGAGRACRGDHRLRPGALGRAE